MYWGWVFAWDGAAAKLAKGGARVSIEVTKSAEARRQVDCFLLTNDPERLIHLRARYLICGTGRFLTRDPAGGRGRRPSSLHRYLLAADDPVNKTGCPATGERSDAVL